MAYLDQDNWLGLQTIDGTAGIAELGSYAVENSVFGSDAFAIGWPDINPSLSQREDCCYQNAATCPDCGSGMIRLGGCFSCHNCGYETCGI